MTLLDQFKSARRAATPLICIRTADPAATIREITASFNGEAPPVLHWDIIRAVRGINEPGRDIAQSISGGDLISPIAALEAAAKLPELALLFFANAHRVINDNGVSQAIWNLRDAYKTNKRTLVLLCPMLELPAEIVQDVLVLDEPLPGLPQLTEIVKGIYLSAEQVFPPAETMNRALDALCGLAAFPAEQVTAMSISKTGLDLDALWERKRQAIEQQKGLSVWRGGETFDGIGGCENVKSFMGSLLAGNEPPRGIVFLDEIEKQFAGTGTDTSGVSTEMTGALLTWMQDKDASGCIFVGPPGAAKSMVAKAAGNSGGIPTIAADFGAMKSSLVGESGLNLRACLKVIEAVTQGRSYWIATCNSMGVLPPELRRRFADGPFYFDLPTESERKAIWKIYCAKYGHKPKLADMPYDNGWTGAEIRTCCRTAWRLKISLKEAAAYIVPVARSAADQISRLREQANGNYISASYSGVYQLKREETPALVPGSRKLEMN